MRYPRELVGGLGIIVRAVIRVAPLVHARRHGLGDRFLAQQSFPAGPQDRAEPRRGECRPGASPSRTTKSARLSARCNRALLPCST